MLQPIGDFIRLN